MRYVADVCDRYPCRWFTWIQNVVNDNFLNRTIVDSIRCRVSEKGKKDKDKDKDKGKKEKGDKSDKEEKENKNAEEKRKHIKSLIDKIPTQKEQLFQYKLDTAQVTGTANSACCRSLD